MTYEDVLWGLQSRVYKFLIFETISLHLDFYCAGLCGLIACELFKCGAVQQQVVGGSTNRPQNGQFSGRWSLKRWLCETNGLSPFRKPLCRSTGPALTQMMCHKALRARLRQSTCFCLRSSESICLVFGLNSIYSLISRRLRKSNSLLSFVDG